MSSSNALTDSELISLIKDGDETAFNEVYKRYWKKLYNEAFKRINDTGQCEEILQDVFADLWIKRENKIIGNLPAYLIMAVRYQIYMLYTKNKRLPYFEEPLEHMAVSSVSADSHCLEMDLKDCIAAWLITQPEKRREIFRLRHMEDMTTKEISNLLNISQKTVQNQLTISFYSLRSSLTRLLIIEMVINFLID